jgi:ketosteroid isomerase-like protein
MEKQTMSATLVQQTEAVFSHHLAAVSAKDVDEVMVDYTDASFIMTQNGVVRGLQALRSFFEAFVAGLTPEVLGNFQIIRLDFEGDVAYFIFTARPLASLGTDTFVVKDGKIVAQTFTILG